MLIPLAKVANTLKKEELHELLAQINIINLKDQVHGIVATLIFVSPTLPPIVEVYIAVMGSPIVLLWELSSVRAPFVQALSSAFYEMFQQFVISSFDASEDYGLLLENLDEG